MIATADPHLTGATSTSEPHPSEDPEAINPEAPKLDRYAHERARRQR